MKLYSYTLKNASGMTYTRSSKMQLTTGQLVIAVLDYTFRSHEIIAVEKQLSVREVNSISLRLQSITAVVEFENEEILTQTPYGTIRTYPMAVQGDHFCTYWGPKVEFGYAPNPAIAAEMLRHKYNEEFFDRAER